MQFQAICSKANKKLTLSLSATDIEEARALLHGQGYSIMELKEKILEAENPDSKSNYFYFDIIVNGQLKTGKIQSDDVFKSYKKLIEDLGYNVVYIYTNEGMNEEQKKVITAKVRDSYRMYKISVGEDIDEVKETKDQMEIHEISPEILRQVEQYTLIIDSTLEKIQNLILKYHTTIPLDKKLELEETEHLLLQAKGSSNIGKIKMIVENALKNIGQIELELAKSNNADEKKKFLQETNSLLKQIGSSDRIETTDTPTFEKSVSDFVSKFKKKEAPEKKETKKVDTNSFIYYKNQRELNIYREILGKNDLLIMKMIFTFQWGKVKRLFLKKKLLMQNIQIIDNRIHNRNISYTKVVKGFQYYVDVLISTINYIARTGSYILFLYILTLLTLKIGSYFGVLDYGFQENKSILYITLFSIVILLFSFVRSIVGLMG
jgi:hypothetical protein